MKSLLLFGAGLALVGQIMGRSETVLNAGKSVYVSLSYSVKDFVLKSLHDRRII